jgi:hypothetical protein
MANSMFNIRGIPEVKRALETHAMKASAAVDRAVVSAANDIFNDADQLVPIDEGVLRSSGRLDVQRNIGGLAGMTVTISYGGAAKEYAIVQHERLDFWHPPKPPGKSKVGGRQGTGPGPDPSTGRGPKYLERPFLAKAPLLPEVIVKHIRAEFFGGGA